MKKKFLLVLFSSTLLLSSCAFHNEKDNGLSYEEERVLVEEALEDVPIVVEEYDGDLTPLPIQKDIYCEETKSLYEFKHGDENQYLTVVSHNPGYNPKVGDLKLVDEEDNEIAAKMVSSSNGVARYMIPVSSFDEDHQYHAKLENDNLKFATKDKSIRELTYYSLDVNDSNRRHIVERNDTQFKNHDLKDVQYFDVDAFGAYFVFDGTFNANVGEYFRISDLSIEKDTKETVYGKVSSISDNPNGAGKVVRYEPCQGEDLYKNLDVNDHISVTDGNIDNLELYNTPEDTAQGLGKSFLEHEDVVTAMTGLFHYFKVDPKNYRSSIIDWASSLKVSFNLKFEDSTFTWGCSITLDLTPKENFSVKLSLSYKQTTTYDITASLKIKWKWFIPTGVKYELKVEEDDTKEVKFKISISTNLCPMDEEKIREGIQNDLMTAMTKDTDVKSKFAGDSPTSTADGKSYPLFKFDCYYFFPLDIRFEIDFYWKLQITVETEVTYTSHSHRTDISINNNKGCDPHSETQTTKDKNLTFAFMGTFHAEVGLQATLGIGISGLYKFFHAEVFIKAYGAVDAQGYLIADLAWIGDDDMTVSEHAGGKFEISVGVKWGVDVALLFGGFTSEWPIATVVLLGFCNENCIDSFAKEEDTIEVTDKDVNPDNPVVFDLDDYHFLGVNVFDAKNMRSSFQDLKHTDGTKMRYGAFLNDYSKNYFETELIEGSEYIDYNDFKFSIKSDIGGIAEFTAKVKVTVNDDVSAGTKENPITKIIKIHFTNNNKQKIYIKDRKDYAEYIGDYLMDTDMQLPVGVAPRYMKFVGWKNETTEEITYYDGTDASRTYHVPNELDLQPVTFELLYIDYYYWNVCWVDGFGNIVKVEDVYNNESATPPDAATRDQYMVSEDENYEYVFVGWDKEYSSITQNTVIRGLYEYRRVGA
jgi:hypothetical protein